MSSAPQEGVLATTSLGFFFLVVFFVPAVANGVVSISEVLYDPEGSDTKHEWIEVVNDGATVDLSEWKVFEGGTNHKLTLFSGSQNLSSGGYAIIADDAETFLIDFPAFSGTVFDTAFTGGLNNTNGETITIRDSELNDISSLTYDVSISGAGDGKSLQKSSASWVAATPTPGYAYSGTQTQTQTPDTSSQTSYTTNTTTTTASNTELGGAGPVDPQMYVSGGDDRTVIVGAGSVFSATAAGLKNEALPSARYVWNFGNGESREGKSVLFTYPIPGTYVVSVDASSGPYSATDRLTVVAIPADIRITELTPEYVALSNNSTNELDVGLWQIASGEEVFTFPTRSIIMPRSVVKVSVGTLGFTVTSTSTLSLLYPHGGVAGTFGGSVFMSQEAIGSQGSDVTASKTTSQKLSARTLSASDEAKSNSNALVASAASSGIFDMRGNIPFWGIVFALCAVIGLSAIIVVRIRGS